MNKSKYYIILICTVVLILSTRGITNESVIAMNGDMPKYLMNGVFFYDLMRDLPITDPIGYAYKYFARYPALSLGHHPLLLGVAEVPFYSIFGISVFSARLTIVFFMLLAAIAWFLLVKAVYNETIAYLSSLLFVTTPYVIEYSRIVMTEIPTLALIIMTTYFFYQYCESNRKKYAFVSAVSLSLSIYSKHIAIFLLPVFLFYLVIRKGVRILVKKEVIISYLILGILLLPFILITVKFSHSNVELASESMLTLSSNERLDSLIYYFDVLWKNHLILPVLMLSFASIVVSIYRRDSWAIFFLLWIVSSYLLVSFLMLQEPRYAMYWIPAFCLFATTSINFFHYRAWKVFVTAMFLVIAGYQFSIDLQRQPGSTDGYEEAAKYIIENKKGQSVLFSSVYDTGYFIFYIRKHDPGHNLIILRANKILATSMMNTIIEEKISKREDIYEILKNYGVRYVVIEDNRSQSRSLEWLRDEVKSDKFILCKEIVLRSTEARVNNVPLAIYEFKDYTPPRGEPWLRMRIPLMGDSIRLPFKDLLKKTDE